MCTPRKSLFSHLQNEFQNDEKLAENCRLIAKKAVQQGLVTRLFDHFPCLLPSNEITALTHELRRIVVSIDPEGIIEKNNGFAFAEEDDKNAIFLWQMKIIEKGAFELFEKNDLKKEIQDLLGLKDIKIEPSELLCAYVGAINQHIIQQFEIQFKKLMFENSFIFNMIFYEVNKKYGKWSKTILILLEQIPLLTQSREMEYFATSFENIVLRINANPKTFAALSEDHKNQICQWQAKLIRESIHNTHDDEEGELNLTILKNIGLENIKISSEELVYMYVRALNHYLAEMKKHFIAKHEKIVNLISTYVHINTVSWIKNELPNAGYVLVPAKIDIPTTKKNSSQGILLVLAAVTTAGAGYASYMFFKNGKESGGTKESLNLNSKGLVKG